MNIPVLGNNRQYCFINTLRITSLSSLERVGGEVLISPEWCSSGKNPLFSVILPLRIRFNLLPREPLALLNPLKFPKSPILKSQNAKKPPL